MPELVIPSRFCGPPGSGNGGYVSGRIAAYVDGPATVTLRRPPPLATPMAVDRNGGSVRVHHDGTLIAEACSGPSGPAPDIPAPVSIAQARAAAGRSDYYADPVFPDCFVCGVGRRPDDGLRIFPGPVPGRALWAAPWTPGASVTAEDGQVRQEVVWAALDCPGGIAAAEAGDLDRDTFVVLGRLTATVDVRPSAGDDCHVIAWPTGRDGRKLTAGSALLGPGGELLATASAIWLTVPRRGQGPAAEGAS
jgi:hypothetical protein